MRHDVQLERIPHELPAFEVAVTITQCANRFEILAKPGAKIDSWQVQAALDRWIHARMDSANGGGHNRPNSIPEAQNG